MHLDDSRRYRSPRAYVILKNILYGIVLIMGYALMCIAFSVRWLLKSWDSLSVDELVFHAKASLTGTNPDMIYEYIAQCIVIPIIVCFIVFILVMKVDKYVRKYIFLSGLCTLVILMATSIYQVDEKLGLIQYISELQSQDKSDFIENNYVDPNYVDIEFPEHKRNLIYIFLESMEMTYADIDSGGAFESNVIEELTDVSMGNENFSGDSGILNGAISLPGSTWTMGAMFAQTSGLPLKIAVNGNQMENQESFFPDIETIGDILEKEGYNQELLLGSNAAFGGRKLYFTTHGSYAMHDYNYAKDNGLIPEDYSVFWGFEDEKLFEFAKKDILELAAKDEPFNLTLLTVDTHFEDGYVCDLCDNEFGDNQYANVMACSSRQVTDFVKWIEEQDFYEDTTIVICGDHPTMDSDFCNGVAEGYQRKTYTTVINSAVIPADSNVKREYSTFDMFPTALAAMGVNIEGGRLGLGVDLFSGKETIIEKYGIEMCEDELEKPSVFLDVYSKVEVTEDNIRQATEATHMDIRTTENGNIEFFMSGMDTIMSANSIDSVNIHVHNNTTSEDYNYIMDVWKVPNDPNVFRIICDTDIPISEIQDVEATVYIDVGKYKNYEFFKWNYISQ